MQCRAQKTKPIAALLDIHPGKLLFEGKIVKSEQHVKEGFDIGSIEMIGFPDTPFKDRRIRVQYQNENLVVEELLGEETRALAVVPTLITLIEQETFLPVTTELYSYGLRAYVVALAVAPEMSTDEALVHVGPKGFNLDHTWNRIAEYREPRSLAKVI